MKPDQSLLSWRAVPVKKPIPPEGYQVFMTLDGIQPLIWRRLLLPARLTLEDLHVVLITVLEWANYHLHEFRFDGVGNGELDPEAPQVRDERKVRVHQVLGYAGATGKYLYDFGDGWAHTLTVERVLPLDPDFDYPVCIAGERQGPLEDSGGPHGYLELLKAVADRKHARHGELREWVGEGFDPEEFSQEQMNELLAGDFRPRKRKSAAAHRGLVH